MKKLLILASLAAVAVAVPAQAKNGAGGPGGPAKQGGPHPGKQRGPHHKPRCSVPYVAGGLFVDASLTQTQGADTERRRDDRYSGSLTVDVKRGNRPAKADVGTTKTYTLTDVKARFFDTNDDGTADAPGAGDRVRLKGKLPRDTDRCNPTGADPELTIKQVRFGLPPQPKPEPEPER
jgi:hypothetical protein